MARRIAYFVFLIVFAACLPGIARAQSSAAKGPTTPNDFLQRGNPTIIFGTGGTDQSDARIRTEARFIRDTLFPDATLLPDSAVDVGSGPEAWPENPVIYGGPHVNRIMAALRDDLPFYMAAGKLVIGELTLEGDEYGLIAVVPASSDHPEFLLYAGTGTPGTGGINSVWHGNEPVLVTDRFGRFASGTYKSGKGGEPEVYFPEQSPNRPVWIHTQETVATASGKPAKLNAFTLNSLPISAMRTQIVDAVEIGAEQALDRLNIYSPDPVNVYLYPDADTKSAITNNTGHGHSTVMADTIHLIMVDPRFHGPIEGLAAHELTHIYAYQKWGPPGSTLMGEGLAVWVAGGYAGTSLQQYARTMPAPPPATALMGSGFSSLPEQQSYPLAGLFVTAAIMTVGEENFFRYLYSATASTWEDSCERAGTTPDTIQQAFAALFG